MNEAESLGVKKPIRCTCSRKPQMAMFGVDEDGLLYIHIKWHKQDRIYGEFLVRSGTISIRCRDCYRWYNISIEQNKPVLSRIASPEELKNDEPPNIEILTHTE